MAISPRARVLACVEQAIAAIHPPKRQRDLWTTWLFVRATRLDTDEPRELPNDSETGRQLGLPRERVGQMLDQLKQLVRRCFDCPGTGAACDLPGNDDSAATASDDQPRAAQCKAQNER